MKALSSLLRVVVPALLAGLLLTGCFVHSAEALFDQDNPALATDAALPGTWAIEKGVDDAPGTLVITAAKNSFYDLKYTEQGKSTELRGALVQVGSQRYLDLWLDSLDQFSQVTTTAEAHLMPVHSFWKVTREGDALTMTCLDYDRLKKGIEGGQVKLDHIAIKDDPIVLTASPVQLRDFLGKYGADPANFGPALTFHRQP